MPILIGIIFIAASVWTMLPTALFGLGWGPLVLQVLMGAAPLFGILIGLVALFIGIADIKDKAEAAREEAEEKAAEEKE